MIHDNLLGESIKAARMNNQITQEELAEFLDVTPTHIKHIESGHRKPSVEVLFALAYKLNMSVDRIIFPENSTDIERKKDIAVLLEKCSGFELSVVIDLIHSLLKNRSF